MLGTLVRRLTEPKRATKYPPCRLCGCSVYIPRGRSEMLARLGHYYVRQPFSCSQCNILYKLCRRADMDKWAQSMTEAIT